MIFTTRPPPGAETREHTALKSHMIQDREKGGGGAAREHGVEKASTTTSKITKAHSQSLAGTPAGSVTTNGYKYSLVSDHLLSHSKILYKHVDTVQ